jgi:hypothetical protein
LVLSALWSAALLLPVGCGEEAIEKLLCRSASNKICNKWFDCWPVISATIWVSLNNCKTEMNNFCDNSEEWSGCDVDNEALRECDQGIEGSPCGSLPPACHNLKDCYQAQ